MRLTRINFLTIFLFACVVMTSGCHSLRAPSVTYAPQDLASTPPQHSPPELLPLPTAHASEILQVGFSTSSVVAQSELERPQIIAAAPQKVTAENQNELANDFAAKVLTALQSLHWRRSRIAPAAEKTARENTSRGNFDTAAQQRNEQLRRLNSLKDGKPLSAQVAIAAYEDSPFRWTSDAVESLLLEAQRNENHDKKQLAGILQSFCVPQKPDANNFIVATNAAILLARESTTTNSQSQFRFGIAEPSRCMPAGGFGYTEPNPVLAQILSLAAQNAQLPTPLRCAAIEALSLLPVDAREVFVALVAQTSEQTIKSEETRAARFHPGIPEIYVESLIAWAQQDFPYEQLALALSSRSVATRQEVMRLWRDAPHEIIVKHQKLPEIFSELWETDQDIEVLSAMPLVLVRWKQVDQFFILRRLLMHQQATVRLAVIAALGECDNVAEAVKLLEAPRHDSAAKTRAAVASAFIALQQEELLLAMADDASSEVRVCVASRLGILGAASRTPQVEEIAQRYLNDPALPVITATIHSLAQWEVPTAGNLLLEALTHRSVAVRVLAAEELKEIWSDFAQYDARKFSGKHDEEWHELQQEFAKFCTQQAFTVTQKKHSRAVMNEETLRETLEKNLTANDVMERRRAAQKLAQETKQRALPCAWRASLFDIALRERDGIVLQYLLEAISRDAPEESVRWGMAFLHHSASEVRRAACGLLAKFGTATEAIALLELLEDENREVIQASLSALEKLAPQINVELQVRREVVRRVAPLLGAVSYLVRADAAAVLYLLQIREGRETLERLALANDTGTQLYATQRIAEVGGAEFAPLMQKLAQENGSVRRIASHALEAWGIN